MENQFSSFPSGNGANPQPTGPDMPMKWHKFLIYFALWLGAVMNVISGFSLLTGSVYEAQGVSATQVYRAYEGLKGVDMLMGAATIALAVLLIVARFALAGYK